MYTDKIAQKRLLIKLLKHFLGNTDSFFKHPREDGEKMGLVEWNQWQRRVQVVTQRKLGNWDDTDCVDIEKQLRDPEHADLRADLLTLGREWYQSCMEQGIKEALSDSDEPLKDKHGKLLYTHGNLLYDYVQPSVHIYEGKKVRSDLYISRLGLCVFLKPNRKKDSSDYHDLLEAFPRKVRTAYTKKTKNREKIIQFDLVRTFTVMNSDETYLDVDED